jgi:uncharacterized protein (TIGR00369 family)
MRNEGNLPGTAPNVEVAAGQDAVGGPYAACASRLSLGYDGRILLLVFPMSTERRANGCFVCGPDNPIGLKVRFRMEDDVCVGEFTPRSEHMGYSGLTHGGIMFTLLDDVMANWLWLQGIQCFTARADIRYRENLPIGTRVRLEGRCERRKGRLAVMEGRIVREDNGAVVAEATGSFMTRPD